jgi:hypothetical protein
MNRFFAAGAAVLAMTASAAMAQTTTSQTTTTVSPVIIAPQVVAPPVGTLSTTRTEKTVGTDGTQTDSTSTTYHNTNGVADDSVTRTTTYPSAVITTNRSSSTSVTH